MMVKQINLVLCSAMFGFVVFSYISGVFVLW